MKVCPKRLERMRHSQRLDEVARGCKRLQEVIDIRNRATHVDEVPSSLACTEALTVYHDIWKSLRDRTVTITVASEIARKVSQLRDITEVCLFGSLARQEKSPRDIDLLVCDSGKYSWFSDPLYPSAASRTAHFIKEARLESSNLGAMVQSRWLDIFPIDLDRFGSDASYIRTVRDEQPDPFFLRNISLDLQRYDFATNRFETGSTMVFAVISKAFMNWSPPCSQAE